MEPVSALCVLIGILIIAARAPLIFAPPATLRFYQRLVANDSGIRGIGVVIGCLAAGLVVLAPDAGSAAAGILRAVGWFFAAAAFFLLAVPGVYRRIARGVLGFIESSLDEAILRALGLAGVAVGVALIYVGIYLV